MLQLELELSRYPWRAPSTFRAIFTLQLFQSYLCFNCVHTKAAPDNGHKKQKSAKRNAKNILANNLLASRAEQSERNKSKMWQIICPKLRQVAPGYQSNSQYLRTCSPDRPIDLLSWPGVCCELS